jgi:hypothetical protein
MLLEKAMGPNQGETDLKKDQYSAGCLGVIQRVQDVLATVPELVSVSGHENDFLYLLNASTDLVLPSLDYLLGFSIQITRNKEKGDKVESIHFYNSDMLPMSDAHFYRLDITSGPEVLEQYNKIKQLVEDYPEIPGVKNLLKSYSFELNQREISYITDHWAETKVTSEQINDLLDSATGYQLPQRHSGLNLKDFLSKVQTGEDSNEIVQLLSS